jgi:hypothetical protein
MAEQAPSLDAQVEAFAQRWTQIFAQELARFAEVGIERLYYIDPVSQTLVVLHGEPMDLQDTLTDFARAVAEMREAREWRDVEARPENQAVARGGFVPHQE